MIYNITGRFIVEYMNDKTWEVDQHPKRVEGQVVARSEVEAVDKTRKSIYWHHPGCWHIEIVEIVARLIGEPQQ